MLARNTQAPIISAPEEIKRGRTFKTVLARNTQAPIISAPEEIKRGRTFKTVLARNTQAPIISAPEEIGREDVTRQCWPGTPRLQSSALLKR